MLVSGKNARSVSSQLGIATYISGVIVVEKTETPVIVHRTHGFTICVPNCLAMHDSNSLNALTKKRLNIVAPPEGHNTFSTMLCIAQCYALVFTSNIVPVLQSYGLNELHLKVRDDVQSELSLASKVIATNSTHLS